MLGFRKVESLEIDGCEELISLRPNRKQLLAHMGSLDVLKISNCPKLVLLRAEEDEEGLQEVDMPRSVDHLSLSLMSSERLREVCFPLTLKRLVIRYCENLQYLLLDKGNDINTNSTCLLDHLEIEWCPSLVWHCPKFTALSQSGKLPEELQRLQISNCPGLKSIAQMIHDSTCLEYIESSLPTTLRVLRIDGCENLQTLPNYLHNLTSLKKLEISHCCFPEEGFPG
ncbi:hypothetical protein REPUB_Repub13aG0129700 [Reevesia pubescens]